MIPIEQLLPAPNPKDVANRKSRRYFYENVIKNLIEPTVDLMLQGITVDFDAINDLKKVIDGVLKDVHDKLHSNEIIIDFRKHWFKELSQKRQRELESKKRDVRYYLKEYKHTDLVMRSYLVNTILGELEQEGINYEFFPEKLLPNSDLAWSVNDLKKFSKNNIHLDIFEMIVDKTISVDAPIVHKAMIKLAQYKAENYNVTYETQIDEIDMSIVPLFKPGSAPQKVALFQYLNIPCEAQSKTTGVDSWGREEVERILHETDRQDIKALCQIFIDYSFSKIIRSNFLAAFDTFVVDGKLHGNYRLGGAKSMRYTSNSPNLLNQPSTGSIYSTPLKKCFVAKPGFIIATADFAALQEVTIANITEDANKIKILGGGYDSHCFHAATYYPRVEEILGKDDGSLEWNERFKKECNSNKELKSLRQNSKPISFKLAFGGFPDADKNGKITQDIFDKYHNVLYPGVTKYNNEVVMEQANREGEAYLGLGFSIRTDSPSDHARTICNATAQFWDIISALTMAEMNDLIKKEGYEKDIFLTSTIYDSLYYECRKEATVVKWLNDNLIRVMTRQLFEYQPVPNKAALDIGPNWADLVEIPNNCSIEHIKGVLDELKGSN